MKLCKDCIFHDGETLCKRIYQHPVTGGDISGFRSFDASAWGFMCGGEGRHFEERIGPYPEFSIPWDKLPHMAEYVFFVVEIESIGAGLWNWSEKSPIQEDKWFVFPNHWHGEIPCGIIPPWPGDWRESKHRRPR